MSEKERPRILIVEDEPSICAICERVLTGNGFEVHVVNDGETAESSVAKQKYDLLLLDLRLPKESGIDFYVWLQQEYSPLSKRVIFMTGSVMGDETMTLLKRSEQPYLLKPFRPEELTSMVDGFLKESRQ